ncbi:glycoside hydrolase family 43 protein [Halalkalibacterium halodurans]|uniref:glycoside hydrolase family 43 protein n=1 Tax=Halalkalibacterium halodurans TaxID=86665 RepID=UPI002E23AEED|nr:glycoside hydrolase family 43 protein [Halalkalibacterium halodurans]MED4085847.1 glycoside hydrolase family 43 protein [Halalkalibacterium halodurans]MED4105192.1 glycoside hydrolase family 43 protein [Halalkalibacterium halodurans]MED4111088.1 glycoside hydrolase family 43 protein [Halalkalibacterium halodurans]MED4125586.1 glycoside hydrolase family 43 protein [Halalkalibacterium halodurans]
MEYNNPVIPGFYPDPSICRVGDDYYLVTSSFEYFPGVPIFHSKDLVHWRQIGHCLTTERQLPLAKAWSSGGIYAPTIRHHNGWFYMVTTNVSDIGNFFVRSEQPAGPWSDPIPVAQNGIDPSLLFDEDGRVYFQSARNGDEGNGIYQCEIDISSGSMLTESRLIWKGTGGANPEAPHLYKINGYYYLMIAEGGTEYGHMVTIARSSDPYGPYEPCPSNPILSHRSLNSSIHATGHADLVQAHDGSWWAVFLGIRPASYPYRHHLGRETFLAPVSWTTDGWPVIGHGGRIEPVMAAPQLPEVRWPLKANRDDFDDTTLGFDWTFLRNPAPESWSLHESPGNLVLRGNKVSLDDAGAPAFVGRRLCHMSCNIAALLDFEPVNDGEEAGLTVFMNERYHYDLAVKLKEGRKVIVYRRTVGSMRTEYTQDCPEGAVTLKIEARPESFLFKVQQDQSNDLELGSGETHLLSTEVAGGFTGILIAMYAVCERGQSTPARFDWFDYKPMT